MIIDFQNDDDDEEDDNGGSSSDGSKERRRETSEGKRNREMEMERDHEQANDIIEKNEEKEKLVDSFQFARGTD